MSLTDVWSSLRARLGREGWVRDAVPVSFVRAADHAPPIDVTPGASATDALVAPGGPARVELWPRERHVVEDSLQRALCHGDPECLRPDAYQSEPATFVRLPAARVDPRWGIVQTSPGRFLEESVHATRWLDARLSNLFHDPVRGDGPLRYVRDRHGVDVCRADRPARRLRGTHLVLGHWAANNYGHFLMDCLPGPYLLLDALRDGRLSLLCRPLVEFQRQWLARLGVPARSILEVDDVLVEVEHALFPTSLTCCWTPQPSRLHGAMWRAVRRVPDPTAARRIFVSRAARQRSRVMVNEAELRHALFARGFREIDPGRHSVDEQARLFSNAEVVVGPLGAGMANVGFCPPGASVVQILPEPVAETWTAFFSHVLGHRSVFVIAPVVERRSIAVASGARDDVEFSYETPLDPTLAAIDAMLV